ncbi:MAG: glutaredoxin 3 [Kiloniellales bacterium]
MARVEIYTSMLCGYCAAAKRLLDKKGVAYEEIDVMLRPARRREMAERSGGRRSVPQIFVEGKHLGNCDDLFELEADGELDALLEGES